MRHAVAFVLSALLFFLSACGGQRVSAVPAASITVAPTPVIPTLTPTLTPTPDPLQLYIQVDNSQATAQAAQSTAQWYSAQATATANAYALHQTATAQFIAAQTTATAQHIAAQATAIARSDNLTATARAWDATTTAANALATSTANKTATVEAFVLAMTQRVVNVTATADAASASAYATAMAGRSESVRLAIERERMTNRVQAFAPWGILILSLLVVVLFAHRRSRIVTVERDLRGDAKLLVFDGRIVYDPDRNPAPVLDLSGRTPSTPIPADPATVARDQTIDMAHRGLPGRSGGRRRILPRRLQANPTDPLVTPPPIAVRLLPPRNIRRIARDVLPSMLMDVVEGEIAEDGLGEEEGGESV